jgi:L-threonylcarbamoyladenylate synthase
MTSDMERAAEVVRAGGIVVLPTDTVYGIGAAPHLPGAIDAVYRAKGRPEDKPLPVLAASVDDLAVVVEFDRRATDLARRFWPGPLTLVLPRATGFEADLGGAGVPGIGVRVPANEPALALLERTGPLAVTSANKSDEAPATTADEARRIFGTGVDVVIDGGICDGVPSTVLSLLDEATIVRPGPLDREVMVRARRRDVGTR